jgi:O-antigen/teichoic acid export membrane protein
LFIPARAIAQMIGEGFKGTGRPAERTRVSVVGVVAGVLAMAALIPPFGLIGVALGVSVDAMASAVLSIRRAHRAMSIPMAAMLASIAAPCAAALVMAAVMIPIQTLLVDAASHGTALGLTLLAGEGALGFAIYAAALRIAAPGAASEFAALLRTGRRGAGHREPQPLDA